MILEISEIPTSCDKSSILEASSCKLSTTTLLCCADGHKDG